MGKRVRFDDEARLSLWRGVDQLAQAVRITLGPRGRGVVIALLEGEPAITRDGIAVAAEIELADPFENLGVRLLRAAALRTAEVAGDGTSTTTVLAHRLLERGRSAVAAGHHPLRVRRGIEQAVSAIVAQLAALACAADEPRVLECVASTAAGERALGALVARALARVGSDGMVSIEPGQGFEATLDVLEGTRVPAGYVSPYFITHPASMEALHEHALVALVDSPLERAADVIALLEHVARAARPMLLVCESVGGHALAVLVANRMRGTAPCVAVAVPGPSAERRELFEDLALVTGGVVVAGDLGRVVTRFDAAWFGRAGRVRVSADETTVLQGGGHGAALAARRTALRAALAAAASAPERHACALRLARLAGGVALIRAGAPSELEQQAQCARLEDALAAARAALAEGVVPGGGVALLRAGAAVAALVLADAEAAGRDAVLAALAEPVRQIALNAGHDGEAVVARLRAGEGAFGFDARAGRFADLDSAGVLDPARVVRCALQNAAGVAVLLLTTDALVVDDEPQAQPEDEAAA